MKKYIYITLFSFALLVLHTASASGSLWEYFQGNLPSFIKRTGMYRAIAPDEYRGTVEQNNNLLRSLEQPKQELTLGAISPVAGNTYNLAGSGITGSQTSLTLQSFTIKQTGQELLTADVASTTGIFYLTLEPGSNTRQEIISCTTVAQSSNNTNATLSGCVRGLSPIAPFTASTTMQFSHAGGTQVILSDPPQFFNQFTAKDNPAVISGLWKYSSTTPPRYDQVPANHNSGSVVSTTSEFASVAYVNATGAGANVSASETVRGEVELATAAEIALGTSAGGTGARLVPPNSQVASTTPSVGAAGLIPATGELGTISNQFIATSSTNTYRFGGPITFSGATTTISGGLNLGIGVGTTTNSQNATFAIEAEAGNRPALLISDRGTSTPVFQVNNGASTTFAFDRTEFNQCVVRAEQNTPTTLGNNSTTTIAMDAEEFDTCNMHDTVTNNSRLTAVYAGYYLVTSTIAITHKRVDTAVTTYNIFMLKNGVKIYAEERYLINIDTNAIDGYVSSLSAVIHLAVNEYVEMAALHDQNDSDVVNGLGTNISATLIGK